MNEESAKNIAALLLGEVENMLDHYSIAIPSGDREGLPEEARLYGSEYYNMEDAFVRILKTNLGDQRKRAVDILQSVVSAMATMSIPNMHRRVQMAIDILRGGKDGSV